MEPSGPGTPLSRFACARRLPRRNTSASVHSRNRRSRSTGLGFLQFAHATIAPAIGPDPLGATSLPIDTRSFISVALATRQPSPTSPMRIASGTVA